LTVDGIPVVLGRDCRTLSKLVDWKGNIWSGGLITLEADTLKPSYTGTRYTCYTRRIVPNFANPSNLERQLHAIADTIPDRQERGCRD